jgi:cell division septation protein DedD
MDLGFLRFLRRKTGRPERRPNPRPTPADGSARPKNGRLAVALVGAILLMIGLGMMNVRLIRDPSIAGKFFGSWASERTATHGGKQDPGETEVSEGPACPAPPEVTFYRKLKAHEDRNDWNDVARGGADTEGDCDVPPEEQAKPPTAALKPAEKSPAQDTKRRSTEQSSSGSAVPTPVSLPRPQDGAKTFMVQVGAFSHPNVAQQWAGRWKSRGYDVVLKPAARPKTGVIYRLCLGNFTSEAEADKLVKKLKAKEGITAFRLTVRSGN